MPSTFRDITRAAYLIHSQRGISFDHLVGAEEYRGRHGEAEGFSSLHVDHKLELRRLFDRQVRRFRTLENLVDENGGATIKISKIGPVGQKKARLRKLFRD